jgi:hypothetical protein
MSFQGFRSQAASFLNAQARRITGKSGDTEARSLPGAHGAGQSDRSSCRELKGTAGAGDESRARRESRGVDRSFRLVASPASKPTVRPDMQVSGKAARRRFERDPLAESERSEAHSGFPFLAVRLVELGRDSDFPCWTCSRRLIFHEPTESRRPILFRAAVD